jgi:hypothetical protein
MMIIIIIILIITVMSHGKMSIYEGYEGRSEINASYFLMLAHDVRGECC